MKFMRLPILALLGIAATAGAQVFYPSIDSSLGGSGGPGSPTYTSITVGNTFANGITATLTMASGTFHVINLPSAPQGPFANVNGAAVFNNTPSDVAIFTFSGNLTEFRANFAADGWQGAASSMIVQAYLGLTLVGSQVFGTTRPVHYDEGQIDFILNSGFNKITVSLQDQPTNDSLWAIGADANHTGSFGGSTPVPEPSTYGLALGGLALVGAVIRRRKTSK